MLASLQAACRIAICPALIMNASLDIPAANGLLIATSREPRRRTLRAGDELTRRLTVRAMRSGKVLAS